MSRKEILGAKEKIVHAKAWKAKMLYNSAYADLRYSIFSDADLSSADFRNAVLYETDLF